MLNEYYDLGEYIINYRAKDDTNYFDVFASFIEIMKEKFKAKAEINDELINEIKKKFEGLISNTEEAKEINEEPDEKEEDQKE
jgi:anaerobic ribonucleoside-triphosphate reductase